MVGPLASLPHGGQHPPRQSRDSGWFGTPAGSGGRKVHSLSLSDPSGISPEERAKVKRRAGLSYPQHHALFCISPSL